MAKKPFKVVLRSYQVGFGDCFLLSFLYAKYEQRHILIDFGTTALPNRWKPSEYMPKVAKQIAADCGGVLTAVVATHRHADHISGFGTDGRTGGSGEIIRELKPKMVIQPWTEDPEAVTNARCATSDSARSTMSFIAGLAAMHAVAHVVTELTNRPPAWMGVELAKELRFLGMDNVANHSAVKNLIAMGRAPGTKAAWVRHGSDPGLRTLLPGVRVRVLGPPSLEQTEKIRKQRSRDVDQFWHLLARGLSKQPRLNEVKERSFPASIPPVPPEARWFRERLQRLRGQQLLQIVRALDAQMNNTSVILLFEVGSKKLLFPGDAQIENWSYALEDAPDHEATRALVADVDLYKVGHHGSLNATPKQLLWQEFTKRGSNKRLTAILSTLPGKHGRARNDTEVPRRPLLKALEQETDLKSTDNSKNFKPGKMAVEVEFLV